MTHYGGSPVFYGAVNKAVDVGEVKADMDLIIELGEYLGQECLKNEDGGRAFKDLEDFLTQRRTSGPIHMDFDGLRHRVAYQRGVNYRKYETGKLRPDAIPASSRRPAVSNCGPPHTRITARIRCPSTRSLRSARIRTPNWQRSIPTS